jgi:hypothetical protein
MRWTVAFASSDRMSTGKVNVLVQQGLCAAPELKRKQLLPQLGTNDAIEPVTRWPRVPFW